MGLVLYYKWRLAHGPALSSVGPFLFSALCHLAVQFFWWPEPLIKIRRQLSTIAIGKMLATNSVVISHIRIRKTKGQQPVFTFNVKFTSRRKPVNDTPESRCLLIHLRVRERERDSVSYCLTGSIHASSALCTTSTFIKLVRTHWDELIFSRYSHKLPAVSMEPWAHGHRSRSGQLGMVVSPSTIAFRKYNLHVVKDRWSFTRYSLYWDIRSNHTMPAPCN